MKQDDCQAAQYCNGYGKVCDPFCIGYIQIQHLYNDSDMPKFYQREKGLTPPPLDYDAYVRLSDIRDDIEEFVKQGRGLFLYGASVGNGKTTWATKLMNAYFKKIALKNDWTHCRGVFVSVPDYLQRIRDSYNSRDDEQLELVDKVKEKIRESDLVVWDDIGAETDTVWVREQLYTFINHRQNEMLSQIFTSNLSLEVLQGEKFLGQRIVSRIRGQCAVIQFFGDDKRGAVDD